MSMFSWMPSLDACPPRRKSSAAWESLPSTWSSRQPAPLSGSERKPVNCLSLSLLPTSCLGVATRGRGLLRAEGKWEQEHMVNPFSSSLFTNGSVEHKHDSTVWIILPCILCSVPLLCIIILTKKEMGGPERREAPPICQSETL